MGNKERKKQQKIVTLSLHVATAREHSTHLVPHLDVRVVHGYEHVGGVETVECVADRGANSQATRVLVKL